jgi:hypothetical protein
MTKGLAPHTRASVHKAGKAGKAAVHKAGKVAHRAAKTTAKVAGAALLPAAPAAVKLARGEMNVADTARRHMAALRAGEAGSKVGALHAVGKGLGVASTFILPALAAAAALSTARDVYKRSGRIDEAAGEGAYSGADLLLGGALNEYARSREAGESRVGAVANAALEGVNNRFFFGQGDEILRFVQNPGEFAKIWPKAPDWLKARVAETNAENAKTMAAVDQARNHATLGSTAAADPLTSAIVQQDRAERDALHANPAAAAGLADLSAMTRNPGGAGRLDGNQQRAFIKANAGFKARQQAAQQKPPAGQADQKPRGFANPANQKSAQAARGVENFSDWADDATVKSA